MPELSLELRPDRRLVPTTGGRVHLLARLRAPDVTGREPRLPLNLGLVIDASGSMSGPPLLAAKHATASVVQRLAAEDIVSVVSFADDVIVHADANQAEQHAGTLAAIYALETRGCTDLAGGWLRGAKCVADEMARHGGRRNHVVVFSDGHANRGILDPEELAQHARALRERQLGSSCVGIGEGYSTHQLYAIAEHGGGRMHHAADPEQIATVVLGELDDVRATVAEGVTVRIEVPADARAEVIDACPVRNGPGAVEADLGALLARATRDLVVQLDLPPGPPGEQVTVSVRARWRAPATELSQETEPLEATITYVPQAEAEAQAWDIEATRAAATAWLRVLIQRAIEHNREHRYHAVARLLGEQGRLFEEYCVHLPEGHGLVMQLRRELSDMGAPRAEDYRKEIQVSYYKAQKGEIDKRGDRGPWPAP